MSESSRQIGIGFIGVGDIAPLHAKAIERCPGAELVGVWNRTAERGRQRAEAFGCRFHASAEGLVDDPSVDAVFVLTNLETHLPYAKLALEAGKHVLVEKPVGVTIAEIEEMKRLASSAGLVCMPGHNYIHEQSIQRSREMIDNHDIGRLVSVYIMYNIHHAEEVAQRYPGVIRQILTHNAYTLLYLGGPPVRVSAMKACLHYQEYKEEDIAMVNLELANGALAHLCASFAADDHSNDPWTIVAKVIGTAGSTRYSYRDWVETRPSAAHSQTYAAYQGSIANEVRHFVHDCVLAGRPPLSTLDDAITAQRVIEAIERSIEEGRTVEF